MFVHPSLSLSSFPATRKPQSSSSSLCPNQCSSSLPFRFLPLSPHPHQISGTHRSGICAATAAAGGGREVDTFTANSGYLFELSASEADSLAEYSISKIAAIYRRKPLIVIRRLFQIGTTFGKWFGLRFIDSLIERSDEMFEVRAAELRKILVELGPAYIKIAQAVSSHPDLIPPSYLDELSLLQDRISPFSTEVAFSMLQQELGLPIDELFSEISPSPVAAASLGQVYQARLRQGGQVVAVKVQRPGVQAAISLDMLILRVLADFIERAGKFNTDLQAVVDEWASSLFRERSSYPTKRPANGRSRILQCTASTIFLTQDAVATSSMASVDSNTVSDTLKQATTEITHALPLENFHLRLVLADLDPATAKLAIGFLGPFLSVFGFLFILRIVMSWYPKLPVGKFPYVIAYAPTEPILVQTRKVIPPLAGVDVTPVVWFGLISFLNEILVGPQGLLVLLSQQVN